jgi:hypothetical protein
MSWFTDIMQDFVNLQQQFNQVNEEYKKLRLANQQQLETIKRLTQELKEKGDGSKS